MKVIKSYWKWEVKEKTFEKKGALSCLVEPQMNEETKQELQYSDFRRFKNFTCNNFVMSSRPADFPLLNLNK